MLKQPFDAADKTPAQGPFAMRLERIEAKIDTCLTETRTEREAARLERKETLARANAAYQRANLALWARRSWGPYVVSTIASLLAAAALATACGH